MVFSIPSTGKFVWSLLQCQKQTDLRKFLDLHFPLSNPVSGGEEYNQHIYFLKNGLDHKAECTVSSAREMDSFQKANEITVKACHACCYLKATLRDHKYQLIQPSAAMRHIRVRK